MTWKKKAATTIAAIVLALGATDIVRAGLVVNGGFETTPPNSFAAGDKKYFSAVQPTGWSGGDKLTFLDAPGTADNPNKYLAVYGPFPTTSPDGGNFVEADGDPNYRSAITQTISGLTIGQTYAVSFYQAAGQQLNYTGSTTERWLVGFAGSTQLSSQFSLKQAGVGAWQAQTLYFTANSTSSVLSFLAAGAPGVAHPPISFLDGVSIDAVPEPSTVVLAGAGLLGLGVINLVRRRRAAAAVLVA